MAGVVELPRSNAFLLLGRDKWGGWSSLLWGIEVQVAWGPGQTVELGAVHFIPDSYTATSPTCHRIPRDMEADREEAQHLGVR